MTTFLFLKQRIRLVLDYIVPISSHTYSYISWKVSSQPGLQATPADTQGKGWENI